MTLDTYIPQVGISISEAARIHIGKALANDTSKKGMRLFLQTSGCSGFMYETELRDGPAADDTTFQIDSDLSIYVPNKDLPLLNGTEIDFVTEGLNSMFQFKNPNVTGECGCGESFSVTQE